MKNRFEVNGEEVTIYANTKGEELGFVFDLSDLPKLQSFKGTYTVVWKTSTKEHRPYLYKKSRVNKKYDVAPIHRWITDAPEGLLVDHIDRNTQNNKRSNLRFVNHSQNSINTPERETNTGEQFITRENHVAQGGRKYVRYVFRIRRGGKVIVRKKSIDLQKVIDFRDQWIRENGQKHDLHYRS